MARIQVCLSPALLQYYDLTNQIVVVTDVLRATSTMVEALDLGIESIIPVATREEAMTYIGLDGYLVAGERDGKKVEGFDLGNSPMDLQAHQEELLGNTLVMTTTNGTKAIKASQNADRIFIGALTNVDAVARHIVQFEQDILVLCAGWKNKVNMEDSLFGGALCSRLQHEVDVYGDAAIMTKQLFEADENHLYDSIKNATHFKRLQSHGIEEDIKYCMTLNRSTTVPVFDGKFIIKAE